MPNLLYYIGIICDRLAGDLFGERLPVRALGVNRGILGQYIAHLTHTHHAEREPTQLTFSKF